MIYFVRELLGYELHRLLPNFLSCFFSLLVGVYGGHKEMKDFIIAVISLFITVGFLAFACEQTMKPSQYEIDRRNCERICMRKGTTIKRYFDNPPECFCEEQR